MRLVSSLLVLLALCEPAHAAIAFVTSSTGGCTASASTCSSSTVTIAGGNTIIVWYAIKTTTSTANAPTATGNTFTKINSCGSNNSTNVRVECWSTSVNGSVSLSSVAITCNLSATSAFACGFGAYSGVVALGTVGLSSPSGASPTLTVTTHDANNWCVGFFATGNTSTFTAAQGTQRVTQTRVNASGAMIDNTVASPGTCTIQATDTQTVYAAATLELRTVSTPMKTATPIESNLVSVVNSGNAAHFGIPADVILSLGLSTSQVGTHFATLSDSNLSNSQVSPSAGRAVTVSDAVIATQSQAQLLSHIASVLESVYNSQYARGSGSHYASPLDSLSASDIGSGNGTHLGTASDALVVTQSQVQLGTHVASPSEVISVSQYLAGIGRHFAGPLDSIFLSDRGLTSGLHSVTVSEMLVNTLLQSQMAAHVANPTDLVYGSQSVASLGTRYATSRDSVYSSDLGLGRGAHFVVISDALISAQSQGQLSGYTARYIDGVYVSQGASTSSGRHVSLSDAIYLMDLGSNRGVHLVTALDSGLINDIHGSSAAHVANPMDAVLISHSQSGVAAHLGVAFDTVRIFETLLSSAGHSSFARETGLISETQIEQKGKGVVVSELLIPKDFVASGAQHTAAGLEVVSSMDLTIRAVNHFVVATDSALVAMSGTIGRFALKVEGVVLGEAGSGTSGYIRTKLEPLGGTDISSTRASRQSNASENLFVNDGFRNNGFTVSAKESLGMAEIAATLWTPIVESAHAAVYQMRVTTSAYFREATTAAKLRIDTVSKYLGRIASSLYPSRDTGAKAQK